MAIDPRRRWSLAIAGVLAFLSALPAAVLALVWLGFGPSSGEVGALGCLIVFTLLQGVLLFSTMVGLGPREIPALESADKE